MHLRLSLILNDVPKIGSVVHFKKNFHSVGSKTAEFLEEDFSKE